MIQMIKSKLTLIVFILLCISLVGAYVASSLYLRTTKELSALQEQHKSLQKALEESVESKDKVLSSCRVTEEVLAKLQDEIKDITSTTNSSTQSIAQYKPKKCPSLPRQENNNEEYVDIDAPFDPEFVRVSESGVSN